MSTTAQASQPTKPRGDRFSTGGDKQDSSEIAEITTEGLVELMKTYNELMERVWEYYSLVYGQSVKVLPSTSSVPM